MCVLCSSETKKNPMWSICVCSWYYFVCIIISLDCLTCKNSFGSLLAEFLFASVAQHSPPSSKCETQQILVFIGHVCTCALLILWVSVFLWCTYWTKCTHAILKRPPGYLFIFPAISSYSRLYLFSSCRVSVFLSAIQSFTSPPRDIILFTYFA